MFSKLFPGKTNVVNKLQSTSKDFRLLPTASCSSTMACIGLLQAESRVLNLPGVLNLPKKRMGPVNEPLASFGSSCSMCKKALRPVWEAKVGGVPHVLRGKGGKAMERSPKRVSPKSFSPHV